jgi:tryptophanyl-tRNA synthetase
MRVLSGVQPSGDLHIGNYFGAIRQFVRLQQDHECYYFLADLHALTTVQDAERMRRLILELTAGFLALGLSSTVSRTFPRYRSSRGTCRP